MPHYPKLSGEKCYLSPLSAEDAAPLAAWLNDLDITLPLGDEAYYPYGMEAMQAEVNEAIQKHEHIFAIVDCATGRLIGRCMLFAIDPTNRSAMLGIFIGDKDFQGKGYGQEASRLLLDYAFNLLNLHSIMLGAFAFNERALNAYRRIGFREIGRRRDARIIAGKAYDVVLMDLLEDEFRAKWGSLVDVSSPPAG